MSAVHLLYIFYKHTVELLTTTHEALSVWVLAAVVPSFFNPLLYPELHSLRSIDKLLLDCPWLSIDFGKRSFSYFAPTVKNGLPLDIRLSPTTDTFKRRLPTSAAHLATASASDSVLLLTAARLTSYYIIIVIIITVITISTHMDSLADCIALFV